MKHIKVRTFRFLDYLLVWAKRAKYSIPQIHHQQINIFFPTFCSKEFTPTERTQTFFFIPEHFICQLPPISTCVCITKKHLKRANRAPFLFQIAMLLTLILCLCQLWLLQGRARHSSNRMISSSIS
ncbi:hypothetical protein AMECASPLE_014411 [Ameca splendens]|uniref:Uncharacterized protein n=1 Tax=Ameca splendens TaxID=208324 RepID=A0ABV0YP10_9TELE